jgi:hypothetical protein
MGRLLFGPHPIAEEPSRIAAWAMNQSAEDRREKMKIRLLFKRTDV